MGNLPQPPFSNPCVIYKPMHRWGGLEVYAFELALTLDAPIYTSNCDIQPPSSYESMDIHEFGDRSWFERVIELLPDGGLSELMEYENFAIPHEHDAVVTIGEPAKAVIQRPHQRRYHMFNMPPRWLFDLGPGRYDGWGGPLTWGKKVIQYQMRQHDLSTIPRINDFIVPSEVIAQRLETYYHREATVIIYPPVDTERFYFEENGGYVLYLGRLAPDKRVDEVVETLSDTSYRLKVAGTGPMEDSLKRLAGDNIEFLGYVSDSRKRELLANCDAVVFNSDREAFGIVPIEAFASGKPVLGVNEGFTTYQIQPGENGILFERGRAPLLKAITELYDRDWDPEAIQESATPYDLARFRSEWRSLITGD